MAYILTDDNIELLKIIYEYGGYSRVKNIELIYPGISYSAVHHKLNKLSNMNYLNSKRLKSNSMKEPSSYQITFPTCKLFNNPDSHFRKIHQEEYIYRALIKNYFFCSIHKEFKDVILSENEKRICIFEEGNFNKNLFPMKYNKNNSFIHFEEIVIDFTESTGKQLIYNDEILYNDKSKNVIIVYIDQYYKVPNKQVINLINKYINMINEGGNFNINFLIVTDDKNRDCIYKKFTNAFLENHCYTERISNKLLLYYKDFLLKCKDIKYHKNIISTYENGELKNKVINYISKIPFAKLSNEDDNIISNIKLKSENYILEKVKEIYSKQTDTDAKFVETEKFFNALFVLEFNRFINLGIDIKKKFDIKSCVINERIYEI